MILRSLVQDFGKGERESVCVCARTVRVHVCQEQMGLEARTCVSRTNGLGITWE